jgi:hypothetical protein
MIKIWGYVRCSQDMQLLDHPGIQALLKHSHKSLLVYYFVL